MKLSEQIKKLEERGIDTSKFNLESNGVVLAPSDLDNDVQITIKVLNSKQDLTYENYLSVIRAYKYGVLNKKTRIIERGIDAYVRNSYTYKDQLKDVIDTLTSLKYIDDEYVRSALEIIYSKSRILDLLFRMNENNPLWDVRIKSQIIIDKFAKQEALDKYSIGLLKDFYGMYPNRIRAKHETWKDMKKATLCTLAIYYAIDHLGMPVEKSKVNSKLRKLNITDEIWRMKIALEGYMDVFPDKF